MTEQYMGGFTFCGRHCGDFGVWYTPGDARLNTRIPAFDIETVEIPGRHGGYYFGNKVKPRVFTLPCFFEDEPEAAWPAIQHWLSRDRFGEQEFDDRPGMVYMARPMEAIETKSYLSRSFDQQTISGTFTLALIAHDPFATMDILSVDDPADLDANNGFLRNHTGLLPTGIMPMLDHSGVIGKTKELLLYNPGNERAALNIEVAGNVGASGLLIYNRTTNQRCKVVGLTKEITTEAGASLIIDGERARTMIERYGAKQLAFAHHDEGYIQLEGACPIDRDLTFRYTAGERKAVCDQTVRKDMIGRYVYLQAQWLRVSSVIDAHTIGANLTFGQSGIETSSAVRMNELVLTADEGARLDKLIFTYKPRYT